ncbi:MAG TPA: septum formation protein Maf [Candidatus Cloacimonetes bacterium]|nr:septum formation protein Maf [Candidatus Cloacimonadota bacterium]HEX37758.1 septum formation protein Maf [Candidatus Cloacimonadota bacterium]
MLHDLLKDRKIILASRSPRRAFLLKQVGLKFTQIPSHIEEHLNHMKPEAFVLHYAQRKAEEIKKYHPNAFIVGADTIVVLNNNIIGKPKNEKDAFLILHKLSEQCHEVFTGVAILFKDQVITDFSKTKVYFNPLSDVDIREYVKTGEPMDKAGAYGIQGYGSQFIEKIEGCYFNVMGFPIPLFYDMCKRLFS